MANKRGAKMSTASILLTPNRSHISQSFRSFFISIQNLIQLKSSFFLQTCKFLNPETLNPISSWNILISNFPTLIRNCLLSNSRSHLVIIVTVLLFFLLATLNFYCVLYSNSIRHSKALGFFICIRYSITFLSLSIQPGK